MPETRPRPETPCPHYPDCVGCVLIGTPYGEQLQRKQARVEAALHGYASLAELAVPAVVGSPQAFGYRNQAKLVARRAGRGLLLGMYRPGTHQVVDIARCPVHDPLIASVLAAVRGELERRDVPVYDERTGDGWLRYVIVRSSRFKHAAQVILVARDRSFKGERQLTRAVSQIRGVTSVVLNLNPTRGNVILGDAYMPVTRDGSLIERVGALKLKSRAGSFLQANIAAVRRVYERVLAWADPQPNEIAVDLYAGVGAIAFYLASYAHLVVGIEESPLAVLDAKENIRLNGFHNARFIAGPAGQTLREQAARLERIDLITLNPPRKGADEPTREAIVACAPSRAVYVSCDPDSLARDLDWFAAHGYVTTAVQPFDLLPQTEHVECVARLERR